MKLRALLYGAALALSNLLLPAPQAQAVTPHHVRPALHAAVLPCPTPQLARIV